MELKGLKINCLGDSITQGCGASDSAEKGYVGLLKNKYGAIARNYGIGGTRLAKQKTPSEEPIYDLDFCSRFAEMDDDADLVLVFGGTNDFGHGDAEIGSFEDETYDTFYGALHTLYRGLIEKYPCSKIVVLTPLHRLEEKLGSKELKNYVNIIREVAEFYSLPVLDLYKSAGVNPIVPIIKEKYMPDGLHPNDAGYELLAEKIAAFIKTM